MTKVSNDAAGAVPVGAEPCVFRPASEMVVGLQAAAAAVAALGLACLPQAPPDLKSSVRVAAQAVQSMPAVQAVRPLMPAESLAGPSLSPRLDSRGVVRDLLKEAGLRPTLDPHRLSWDQARKVNALLPIDRSTADVAEPFHLNLDTANGRQALKCLTQAAYFEAASAGPAAEAAVAQVVLNRVRHPDFPKSVCGVVYQGAEGEGGCQFSFTCDGSLSRPIDLPAWDEARKVAERALEGRVVRAVGTATYYHADYVFPTWATSLVKMATVGPHIFYRMAGPAGAATYFTGRYAGDELKLAKAILRAGARPKAKAEVQLAAADKADIPAGLRVQAERLQRVHSLIAVAPPKAQAARVETASIQAPTQEPVVVSAPAPAAPSVQAATATPAEGAPAA